MFSQFRIPAPNLIANLRGYSEGWSLQGRLDATSLPARSDKKSVRVWLSLTAIGKFCESVGIRTATSSFRPCRATDCSESCICSIVLNVQGKWHSDQR